MEVVDAGSAFITESQYPKRLPARYPNLAVNPILFGPKW